MDIKSLESSFNTPAWAGVFDVGSDMYNLLESLPDSGDGQVDVTSLSLLAIIWCQGDTVDKCDALFQQVNPPS